jgi:hypothetical protein
MDTELFFKVLCVIVFIIMTYRIVKICTKSKNKKGEVIKK